MGEIACTVVDVFHPLSNNFVKDVKIIAAGVSKSDDSPAELYLCQYPQVFATKCPEFVFHFCMQTICKHHNNYDVPENNTPLPWKIFWFDPVPPSPSGNSSFCSYSLFKL